MHMVTDATDLHWNDLVSSCDADWIFPDPLFDRLANPGLTVLGREDNMVVERGVGVGHHCLLLAGMFLDFIAKSLRRCRDARGDRGLQPRG